MCERTLTFSFGKKKTRSEKEVERKCLFQFSAAGIFPGVQGNVPDRGGSEIKMCKEEKNRKTHPTYGHATRSPLKERTTNGAVK